MGMLMRCQNATNTTEITNPTNAPRRKFPQTPPIAAQVHVIGPPSHAKDMSISGTQLMSRYTIVVNKNNHNATKPTAMSNVLSENDQRWGGVMGIARNPGIGDVQPTRSASPLQLPCRPATPHSTRAE